MVGGWNRIYKPNIQLFIVQKEEVFNVEWRLKLIKINEKHTTQFLHAAWKSVKRA
jgi:hypothetical protein